MTEQIVNIPLVNAVKAFKNADQNGKQLLSDLIGKDKLTKGSSAFTDTFEDACEWLGKDPQNVLLFDESKPLTALQKGLNAGEKLKAIIEVANEGQELDYSEGNQQKKYWPYFRKDEASGRWVYYYYFSGSQDSSVVPRLVYLDLEKMKQLIDKHLDLYNDYMNQ